MVERQGGLTEVNDSKAYPWEGNLYELKANTSFLAAVALSATTCCRGRYLCCGAALLGFPSHEDWDRQVWGIDG